MELSLSVDNLSTAEQHQIWEVLQRDQALQNKQYSKINELKNEIQDIRMKGILRDGDDSSRLCARCHSPLGVIFNKGEVCPNCRFKMCKNCRVALFSGGWTCIFCFKNMQLKWLSGDWTHGKLRPRGLTRRASGSDLIRSVLVKSVTPAPGNAGKAVTEEIRRAITNGSVPPPDELERDSSQENSPVGGSTLHDTDVERVGFPSEADSFRLSRLIGSYGGGNPSEEKERVCVKRVSSRPYRDSDSDSSSSIATSPTLSAAKKSGNISTSSLSTQDKTIEGDVGVEQNGHKKLSPVSNFAQEKQPSNNVAGSSSNSNEIEQSSPKFSSPGLSLQVDSKPRLLDLAKSNPSSPKNMSQSIDGSHSALTTQNISASIDSGKIPTSYQADAGSEQELFPLSPSSVSRNIPSSDGSDNEQPIDSYFVTDLASKDDISQTKKTEIESVKPLGLVDKEDGDVLTFTGEKQQVHSDQFGESDKSKHSTMSVQKESDSLFSANRGDVKISPGKTLDITMKKTEESYLNEIPEGKVHSIQKPRFPFQSTPSADSSRKMFEQSPFTEDDKATKMIKQPSKQTVDLHNNEVEEEKVGFVQKSRFPSNVNMPSQLPTKIFYDKEDKDHKEELVTPKITSTHETKRKVVKEYQQADEQARSDLKDPSTKLSTKVLHDTDSKDKFLKKPVKDTSEEKFGVADKNVLLAPSIPSSGDSQHSDKSSSQNIGGKITNKQPPKEDDSFNPFDKYYRIKKDIKISPSNTDGSEKVSTVNLEKPTDGEMPEEKLEATDKPRLPFQASPSVLSYKRKIFEQSPFTEDDDKARKMVKQLPKQNNKIEEEKVAVIQKSRFPSIKKSNQLSTDRESKDDAQDKKAVPQISKLDKPKDELTDKKSYSLSKDPVLHDTDSKDKILKKPVKDTSEEKFGVADKNVLLAPSIPSSGDSQHSDKSSSQNIGGKITNKQPPKEDDSFNPFDKYYRIKKDIKISPSNTDGSEKVSTVNLEKPTDGEMPEEKLEATDKPRLPFQASPSVLSYKRKIFEQSPFTEDDDKARKMVKQLPKQNNKIEEEKVAVIQKSRFPSIKKSNQLSTDRESKDDAQDKKAVPQISKLDKPKDELTDKKSYSLSKDPVLHDTDSKDKILKKPVKDTSEEKFGVADKNVLLAPSIPSSGDSQHSDKSSSQNIGGKITNKQPPREDDSFNPFDKYYRIKKDIKISPSNTDVSEKVSTVNLEKPTDGEMSEEKLEATDKPRLPFQNASSFVNSRIKMFEKSPLTEDDDKARKMMKQAPKQTDNKKVVEDEIGTTIKPKFPSGISSPNWSSVKKANEKIGKNLKATTPVKTRDTPDNTDFIDRSELKIQIQEKQRIVFSRKKPSDSVSRNFLERNIKDSSGERDSTCTPAKSSSEQVKDVKKKKNSQIEIVPVAGKSRFPFRGEAPHHHLSKDTSENQVADVKDVMSKQISESRETENNRSGQVSDKDHTIQHKPQTDFYKTNIQDFHSDSGIQYPNSQKDPTFLSTKPKSVHLVDNSKSPIQDKKEVISSVKESQLDSFSHKDKISPSLPSPSNNTNQVSSIRSEQKGVSDPEKYNNDKLGLLSAASDGRKVPIHPDLISSTNDWIDHKETKLPFSSRETIKRSKPKTSNSSGNILSVGHVVPSDVRPQLASKPVTDKPTASSSLSKPITAAQTSQQTSLNWIDRKETFFSAERTKATRRKHKSEKDESDEKKSTSDDYKSFPEKYPENRPGRVDQSPSSRHSQSDNKVKKFSSSNYSEVKEVGICEAKQKSGLITPPVKEITCKAPLKINIDYKSETAVDCPKDVVSTPHCESDKSTANISNVHDEQTDKKNIPSYENVGVFSEPDMKMNLENETSGTKSADKHVANLASQKTKDGPDEKISSDKLVTNKTPPKSKETTFGPDIKEPDDKHVAEVTSSKSRETTFGPDTKVSADRHVANLASPKTKETTFGPDEDISENRHVANLVSPKSKETTFGSEENIPAVKQFAKMTIPETKESDEKIFAVKLDANLNSPKTKETTFGPDEKTQDDKHVVNVASPKTKQTTFGPEEDISVVKQLGKMTLPKTKESTFSPDKNISADKHVENLASPKSKETTFGSEENITADKHVAKLASPKRRETTFGSEDNISADKHVAKLASPKSKETTFGSEENISNYKHVAKLASPKRRETTFGSEENISADKHVAKLASPKRRETTFGSEENISADKHVAKLASPKRRETTFGSEENISADKHVADLASPKSKETTFGLEENISADKHVADLASPKRRETTFGSEENISADKHVADLASPKSKETTFGSEENISADKHVANLVFPKSKETAFDSEENISADKHVANLASPKSKETTFGSEENISADKHVANLASPKPKETTFGSEENISADKHVANLASPKSKETTFGSEENISADKHVANLASPKSKETTFGSEENISADTHVANLFSLKSKKAVGSEVSVSADNEILPKTTVLLSNRKLDNNEAVSSDHPEELAQDKAKKRIGSRPKQENRVSASRTLPTITRYVSSLQSERTPPSIKSPTELDKPSSSSLDVHSTMTSGKLELSIDDKKENSDTTLVLSKPEDEAVYWIDRKENTFSPNCKASLKKKKPVISQSFEEKLSSGFGLQHKPLSATSISFGNEVSQSKNESEAVNLNSVSEDALSSSKVIPRFSSWIGFKKNDSTPESVGSASIKHNQKQYSMPMKEDKKLDVKDLAQTNNTIKQFNDVVGVNRPLPPAPSMTTDVSEPLLDCWVERKESFLSDSKANSGHWIYTHTRPQLFAKNDNNIETSGRSEKSNEFVNYESSYGNEPETPNTADFPIKENKLQQKSIEDTYLNKKAASEYGLDSVNSNEDVYPLEEEGIKLKVELEFNQGVSRTDTQAPEDQSFTFVKEYTSVEPNSSQSEKFRKPSQSDSNNKDLSKMPESGVYFVEMNSDDGEESNISGYPVEYNNGIISYSSYPKQQNLSSEPYAESDPSKQSSSDHYEPQKPTMKLRQSQKNYSPHFTESVNETEIDSHFENNSEADMLSKWNDTNSPVKAKSITSDFSPRERNYQDTPSFSESCSSRSHPVREMSPIANLRDMVLNDEKLAYQQFLNKPSGNYKNLKQSPENQYSSKALNYRLYEDDNIFKPTELSDAFEYTSSTSEMLPNPAAPNRNKTKYNTQPSHKFVQSDLTDSSQQYVNTDSSDFVVDSGRHL
ncbi:uncharacterized protein LOC115215841 isoform X8 [Octopus sinensis]|uniref:Uncharacterized protein LOC115215841 isoform X8 n=1 Tax=Octopus sinensis TaxID=2607531 RepID=A0A7E6F3Y8_9MOLL|nr:uncharacterized protein LOC115215841 isoform X8 [Octopus sinensis]